MQMDRSAMRTGSESRSASEYATTAGMSRSRHARKMRTAISPRLAMSTRFSMSDHHHATVNSEHLARHIRCIVRGEVCDGGGDVLGRAGAAHGHLIEHPGTKLLR